MSNDSIESISAKLRRWADESYESGMFPSERSEIELKIDGVGQMKAERELFRRIADEIDRELDELRNKFRVTHPMQAVGDIAAGKDEYPLLKTAIDRYYLPRPLFEDGEPVQDSDLEEIGGFATCCVYTDGSWKFDPDKFENEGNPKPWDKQQGRQGDRIKRPEQPVLDAAGVEIKEDDTVYGIGREQHRYTVQVPYSVNEELGERFCVQCYDNDDGNIVWCDPSMLTHDEPVICGDGSRINVGNKVWWDKGDFNPYTVKSLHPDNVLTNHVEIEASDGARSYYVHPSHLTHREPDSYEKLRDDILEAVDELESTPYKGTHDRLLMMADRLTALIELDGRDA